MDLLYSRYSSPMDLMGRYINQGRFGKFVSGFMDAEYDRRVEEARKERDMKLWMAYVHSHTERSYNEWKKEAVQENDRTGKPSGDNNLDNDGIQKILTKFFPQQMLRGGEV